MTPKDRLTDAELTALRNLARSVELEDEGRIQEAGDVRSGLDELRASRLPPKPKRRGVRAVLAAMPELFVFVFRTAEMLFIWTIVGLILLLLWDAGKFANGGWLVILGIAFAIWALIAINNHEKEHLK